MEVKIFSIFLLIKRKMSVFRTVKRCIGFLVFDKVFVAERLSHSVARVIDFFQSWSRWVTLLPFFFNLSKHSLPCVELLVAETSGHKKIEILLSN